LGVARYRAGRYQDSIADLTRSLGLDTSRSGGPIPGDPAFLAMTRHQLGQPVEAREALEQLRGLMKHPRRSGDDESKALRAEAAALIERPTDAEAGARPATGKE